ncbi:hypothetical protein EDB19DRAFT_1009946 [Suillus lakei]|nr:hypothetical protein EDB19DRAFT_1009946 [Suillus lakei]
MQQYPKRRLFARHTGPQPITVSAGSKMKRVYVARPLYEYQTRLHSLNIRYRRRRNNPRKKTTVVSALIPRHFWLRVKFVACPSLIVLSLLSTYTNCFRGTNRFVLTCGRRQFSCCPPRARRHAPLKTMSELSLAVLYGEIKSAIGHHRLLRRWSCDGPTAARTMDKQL